MKLSFIYPSYKRPASALMLLYNITNQTICSKLGKIEVIISVDKSDPEIDQYRSLFSQFIEILDAKKFKAILLENNTDGLVAAKNNAVEEAKGDMIMMLDDDLFMEDEYVEALYRDMVADDTIGAISGFIVSSRPAISHTQPSDIITVIPTQGEKLQTLNLVSDDGNWRSVFGKKEQVMDWSEIRRKIEANVRYEMDYFVNSYMFRKEAYSRIGGYCKELNSRTSAHEEVDFTFRLGKSGYRLLFNPQVQMWHITIGEGGIYKGRDWNESKKILEEEYSESLPTFISSVS